MGEGTFGVIRRVKHKQNQHYHACKTIPKSKYTRIVKVKNRNQVVADTETKEEEEEGKEARSDDENNEENEVDNNAPTTTKTIKTNNTNQQSSKSNNTKPIIQMPASKLVQAVQNDTCALCFHTFTADDTIIFCANEHSPHCFHQECTLDYLVSQLDTTGGVQAPCPLCHKPFMMCCTHKEEEEGKTRDTTTGTEAEEAEDGGGGTIILSHPSSLSLSGLLQSREEGNNNNSLSQLRSRNPSSLSLTNLLQVAEKGSISTFQHPSSLSFTDLVQVAALETETETDTSAPAAAAAIAVEEVNINVTDNNNNNNNSADDDDEDYGNYDLEDEDDGYYYDNYDLEVMKDNTTIHQEEEEGMIVPFQQQQHSSSVSFATVVETITAAQSSSDLCRTHKKKKKNTVVVDVEAATTTTTESRYQSLSRYPSLVSLMDIGQATTTTTTPAKRSDDDDCNNGDDDHQKDTTCCNLDMLKEEISNLESVRHHPHIVDFEYAYEDEHEIHIITELLEGGELYETICQLMEEAGDSTTPHTHTHTHTYFALEDCAYMIRNIVDALSYCHEVAGIVHRDLNASNFMFKQKIKIPKNKKKKKKTPPHSKKKRRTGKKQNQNNNTYSNKKLREIKIIDFGLSTKVDPDTGYVSGAVGTPYYVAPEVLTDEHYTNKCDVWSVGVIAYLLLSLTLPYQGQDECDTITMLMEMEKHPVNYSTTPRWQYLQQHEREAISFCQCLLQQDPTQRPSMREALSHPWIVKHCGVPPVPVRVPVPVQPQLPSSAAQQQHRRRSLPHGTHSHSHSHSHPQECLRSRQKQHTGLTEATMNSLIDDDHSEDIDIHINRENAAVVVPHSLTDSQDTTTTSTSTTTTTTHNDQVPHHNKKSISMGSLSLAPEKKKSKNMMKRPSRNSHKRSSSTSSRSKSKSTCRSTRSPTGSSRTRRTESILQRFIFFGARVSKIQVE